MIEIGEFKIEWVDEDHLLVTRNWGDGFKHKAKVCGGDMEPLLNCLFLDQRMTYETPSQITTYEPLTVKKKKD